MTLTRPQLRELVREAKEAQEEAGYVVIHHQTLAALLDELEAAETQRAQARDAVRAFVEAPPAQIAYAGELLPISAEGMRTLMGKVTAACPHCRKCGVELPEVTQ